MTFVENFLYAGLQARNDCRYIICQNTSGAQKVHLKNGVSGSAIAGIYYGDYLPWYKHSMLPF
jgi:hypothetical protein